MKVLIVGAGIAGPTLAYWLHRFGHEPTLVEQASAPRQGGYIVDFWGAGFDVADRMGIVPTLMERGYRIQELREVASDGHRIASVHPARLFDALGGRYVSIARADLARTIYDTLDNRVEAIFGDTVTTIQDLGPCVRVTFQRTPPQAFDLVIGADGLHSQVRTLTFSAAPDVTRDLGITVAAIELTGYQPRDELIAITHTEPGIQTLRLSLPQDRTLVLFTFRDDTATLPTDPVSQRVHLRRRLRDAGWEAPAILSRLEGASSLYLDRVSQIRMHTWHRGRVVLVGDAAAAPSLLAGQGSALAMIEAYTLATQLHQHPDDHTTAFAAYQNALMPLVRSKQDAAINLGTAFAPRNSRQVALRNLTLKLMGIPGVASLVMRRSLRDPITLPPTPQD